LLVYPILQEVDRIMNANGEQPVTDVEHAFRHVEEKTRYVNVNKDDVGYEEYLESLNIEFFSQGRALGAMEARCSYQHPSIYR
jgi:hypothetical protein